MQKVKEKKENAFICWTPYQVMVSVHITQTLCKEQINDMYLISCFHDAKGIYVRLKEQGVFHEVYCIEDEKKGRNSLEEIFRKLEKTYWLFKREIDGFGKLKLDYDRVMTFSFGTLLSRVMCGGVLDHGGKILILDEGLGSYVNTLVIPKKGDRFLKVLSRCLRRTILGNNPRSISKYYLFRPELAFGIDRKRRYQIPQITENSSLKSTLNYIFCYQDDAAFNSTDLIFFSQPINKSDSEVEEADIVSAIASESSIKKSLIKIHPRDEVDKYEHLKLNQTHISRTSMPWEIICLNEDMGKKTLISIASSALFTPYILFRERYTMILLYKLVGFEVNKIEPFIMRFQELSECDVYIPSDLEEFKDLLKGRNGLGKNR